MENVAALRMVRTEEGKRLRKAYEAHEVHHGYNEHREAEPRTDGNCNTISTVQKDNYLLEAKSVCCAERGRYDENGKIEQHLEPRSDGNTNTLTTVQKDNQVLEITADLDEIPEVFQRFVYEIDGELYLIRIRKLTPRECWRLMGFSDEDFEKAATVNSNTQLYKQAGNSIVKPVLEHLFRQFLPKSKVDSLKLKALALLG